jgi:type IV secretory pathway TraG/TraD family ATPase VirD4
VDCWTGVRDSTVILGPPGSGKGLHLVIPWIVDHPGPVITTSTRNDNIAATIHARAEVGPVAVFDPEGLAVGVDSGPRWSPCRGCERPKTAMQRAGTLVGDSAGSGENDGYWRGLTVTGVQCLLHACALAGGDALDLYRWAVSPAKALEAVHVLQTDPLAQPAWSDALEAILGADEKLRDSVWLGVANTFSMLADPAVLEAVTPAVPTLENGEVFDPAVFLREHGTVYLLGTAGGATARLIAAFVEDLVTVARQLAAASPGARLDPPLGLILDEAANYPLPSLPSLMSEGGGTGMTTTVVLQSLAQARDRWGSQAAQAIWDSATTKVVLGGQANADDLADMSRLCGDVEVRKVSQSGAGILTAGSAHIYLERRPILDPAQLRTLPFGTGILLLRSAKPIQLRLTPWTRRKDAARLELGKTHIEHLLQQTAKQGEPV